MIPLPNIKPIYPPEVLSKFSPPERMAAHYGVDQRFLRFASPPYTTDPEEMYSLHQYSTLRVTDVYGDVKTITHAEQYDAAKKLLDSGMLWCAPAGVIIINSPYYFFNSSDKDPDGGAEAFLAHLLCSLAHRVANRKVRDIEVNYLETMSLDHGRGFHMKPKHLLLWGVCTEHFNSYECQKTIHFLHTFRHHTRILLTSVSDMGELLERLHLHVDHVTCLFNLDRRQEMLNEEAKKSKLTKKSKPKAKKETTKKATTKKAGTKKATNKKTKTVQRATKTTKETDMSV